MTRKKTLSVFPPGARVLVDGRDPAIVIHGFPEGSTSYAFPHYRLRWLKGRDTIVIQSSRVGVTAEQHRADQVECEKQGDWKGASIHDSLAQDHEDAAANGGHK